MHGPAFLLTENHWVPLQPLTPRCSAKMNYGTLDFSRLNTYTCTHKHDTCIHKHRMCCLTIVWRPNREPRPWMQHCSFIACLLWLCYRSLTKAKQLASEPSTIQPCSQSLSLRRKGKKKLIISLENGWGLHTSMFCPKLYSMWLNDLSSFILPRFWILTEFRSMLTWQSHAGCTRHTSKLQTWIPENIFCDTTHDPERLECDHEGMHLVINNAVVHTGI